jgi:hypothetical protein
LTTGLQEKIAAHLCGFSTKSWREDIPELAEAMDAGDVKQIDLDVFAERMRDFIRSAAGSPVNGDRHAEGAKAFRDGADYDECPYPASSLFAAEWQIGWEREMEKKR